MNIQPTPTTASLAGTSRAQATGTDTERRSPAADAATDARLNAVSGVDAGAKSQDRDADGRQLLEKREKHSSNASRDENSTRSDAADNEDGDKEGSGAAVALLPSADAAGTHIDFEA